MNKFTGDVIVPGTHKISFVYSSYYLSNLDKMLSNNDAAMRNAIAIKCR